MSDLIDPRSPKGFQDLFAEDIVARKRMVETIQAVYEKYGFDPLETPAIEYVDTLGKYLPESDTPDGGIFSFRDEDGQWLALRYDLTAPLSRVVAQYGNELPSPFRRYQVSPVWRQEKPGEGRFRQFHQFDFDTVGAAHMAADAEVCAILSDAFEALGVQRGQYIIRVNNRKIMNAVLEKIGVDQVGSPQWLTVQRAIDKYDRLGAEGVGQLLQQGRKDQSGDFTEGAGLSAAEAGVILEFVQIADADRGVVCDKLDALIGAIPVGREGVAEMREIDRLLTVSGIGSDRVLFDPSIVRGLAYYTGPVFEAALTFDVTDESGQTRQFGSVAGGGRYDDLVQRFTGQSVPATGASIGVDRLLSALKALNFLDADQARGPVVVAVFDRSQMAEYQAIVHELRQAGLRAEIYLGEKGMRQQFKYADKRRAPAVVIAGGDELAAGTVSIKDLGLGKKLAESIQDHNVWRKEKPQQVTVPREQMVETVKKIIEGS